jgi:hypothetical protein
MVVLRTRNSGESTTAALRFPLASGSSSRCWRRSGSASDRIWVALNGHVIANRFGALMADLVGFPHRTAGPPFGTTRRMRRIDRGGTR